MVNKVAKTRAAYLGLLVLFIGIISPIVSQYYFERPIEIVASSHNLYLLDIKHDSQKIQEAIEHPKNLKIEDFRVNYEKDGEIRELRYSLVGYLENKLILYNFNFLTKEKVYSVTSKKIDQWSQYERLVLADRFFESLEDINLKEVVEKENLEWYVIEGRGEYKTSVVSDSINFLVKDNKITRIYNSELPISGFNISLYGMLKIEETSSSVLYEGSKYVNYWFQE